jgi:hypothetical protein
VFGIDIRLECREHDIAYEIGGTQVDKDRADMRLKRRVYKKLRQAGYSSLTAKLIYLGTRIGGGNHFNYHDA